MVASLVTFFCPSTFRLCRHRGHGRATEAIEAELGPLGPSNRLDVDFLALLAHAAAASGVVSASA